MSVYISASSLDDFIHCSQRVLYRIKKPFPVEISKEMLIGTIAHSVLEKGWESRAKALDILDIEASKHRLSKSDRTSLSFMIDIFFLNFQQRLTKEDVIEYSFKIPIYDDVFLVGKMDRISNGTIYDWKTGITAKNLQYNVQCIVYDFAYKAIFNKEPSSICVGSLRDGKLIPFVKNELFYKELFTKIMPRMIKTIKSEQYEKLGIFNHSCFKCQFRRGCLGESNVMDNSESS